MCEWYVFALGESCLPLLLLDGWRCLPHPDAATSHEILIRAQVHATAANDQLLLDDRRLHVPGHRLRCEYTNTRSVRDVGECEQPFNPYFSGTAEAGQPTGRRGVHMLQGGLMGKSEAPT